MRSARDRADVSGPVPGATLGAVGRTTLTRRRALALGAAAGLGSLIGPLRALPAWAARGARPRGFGLTVTPADFDGARTSRVLLAPRFDVIGVRGAGRVEVRVRARGGGWSPWIPLAAHGDHAPDTGTGERASDPVWTGGSDEFQLRLARAPRRSLRVHLVAVPASLRRRARPHSAPRARPAQAGGVQPGSPPPIIPRDAWGAAAVPPRSAPSYGVVQAAFVHHTVTANEYGPQDSPAIVLGIAKYHRDTNGWNDIGYNFLVDQYGQVFEGRAGGVDQPVVGAHAQGYNAESTSVAQIGTFTAAGITPQAMTATAQLLGWKLSLHGVPVQGTVVLRSGGGSLNRFPAGTPVTVNRICGHRDGDATSCPGDALYAQLPELRTSATAFAGPIAPPPGQVTLAAGAAAVPYGSPAAFAGLVIRPGGGAAAGVPVSLQKRGSSGAWVTVARATAAADGSWSVTVPWRRSGQVRALSGSTSSAVANVDVVASVKLRAPRRRRLARGTVLRLSGRVQPAGAVRVVVEFKGADGRWRRVRVLSSRRSGTNFSAAMRARRPGLYRFTARTVGQGAPVRDAPLLIRVVRAR
jgi:N-acetylmuramoyl-L-alanine amidase-like protein